MNDDAKPGDSDTPPAGADKNADKASLNSLLDSWDEPKDSDKQVAPEPGAADVMQSLGDTQYLADKAVTKVKGDLDVEDEFVRSYLVGLFSENEALDTAWKEQNVKRDKWAAVLDEVADTFQKTMKGKQAMPDVPDDKGLAAAVHSARDSDAGGGELDNLNWATMSDSDFEAKKTEVFRLAEEGKLK